MSVNKKNYKYLKHTHYYLDLITVIKRTKILSDNML